MISKTWNKWIIAGNVFRICTVFQRRFTYFTARFIFLECLWHSYRFLTANLVTVSFFYLFSFYFFLFTFLLLLWFTNANNFHWILIEFVRVFTQLASVNFFPHTIALSIAQNFFFYFTTGSHIPSITEQRVRKHEKSMTLCMECH